MYALMEKELFIRARKVDADLVQKAAKEAADEFEKNAGFAVETEEFRRLVARGKIAKFELTPQRVIVYLTALDPGSPLKCSYRLRATQPVDVSIPAAEAYEYYDPQKRAESAVAKVNVRDTQ